METNNRTPTILKTLSFRFLVFVSMRDSFVFDLESMLPG